MLRTTAIDPARDAVESMISGDLRRQNLAGALRAWSQVLGKDAIRVDAESLAAFHSSTVGVRREVPAILYPNDERKVSEIVRIANKFRTPIYPVSTGRNWGYGDSSPVTDGCAVVNLSRMNRVVDFSSTATYAVATIQPGVTQQILFDYLQQRNLPFMTPTHGGGPDCSVLGNALERGYGITPITSHHDAITSIRAVLGDGSLYESYFESVGAPAIGDRRKSQVGLDIDSLFAQSNLGIVTQAKVRLRRRPRHVAVVFFRVNSQQALAATAPRIEELLYEHYPKAIGAINLMNRLRVLAMVAPYPSDDVAAGETLREEQLRVLGQRFDVPEWLGAATLYGESRDAIKRTFASFKRRLRGIATGITLCDGVKLKRAEKISRILLGNTGQRVRARLKSVSQLLEIASGKPGRVALPLARWRTSQSHGVGDVVDPAAEGCGIKWYSPYVPIAADCVEKFRQMVEGVCRDHGIEPLITFTTVDDQTFDSTVPLLFDNSSETERARACSCYRGLLHEGLKIGLPPYRYGIGEMRSLAGSDSVRASLTASVKMAFDPCEIIAPSRYASLAVAELPR